MIWLWLAGCGAPETAESPEPACDAEVLDQLAQRHGFTLVFAPCGANPVLDAAWSPSGHELYYQLGMTQHILHADAPDKLTEVVPTATSSGPAVFLTANRVVHPAAPVSPGQPERLAWWDLDTVRSNDPEHPTVGPILPIPGLTGLADLQRTRDADHVLLTAHRDGGPRRVWRVDLLTGTYEEPWPYLGEVDTFTYTPAADAVVTTRNGTATWWNVEDGAAKGTWSPAVRGTVHPRGGWLMLEHEGQPVSVFGADPNAARREAELPASASKTIRPPMLSLVELRTGHRFVFDLFHGTQFDWYEKTDYFGSFVLWGFQGVAARRNVVLTDFLPRLTGAEIGALPDGMRMVGEKEGFLGTLTAAP